MEPSATEIQELRDRFLKKLEEEGSSIAGGIHPADLARIKNSDDWLRRFLLHNDNNQTESLNMAWETCKWRKTFGTNDISEQNVRMDYIEDGSMFSHSRDIDGKSLFILKCKKHVKGQRDLEELKKCLVYWFERLERQDKGDMITLFFDMSGTGYSNMDMDYTKYLISLFKLYYPFFLNYILIFEMPWVLNAAFKLIKTWLPEKAVKKINFVNKDSLKSFVKPENALVCWGGLDEYEFSFVSEDKNEKVDRKVHFADSQADLSPVADSGSSSRLKLKITPDYYIKLSPSTGSRGDASDTIWTGSISLTNADDKIISYKIKTTSQLRYRVRPCLGTLKPGSTVNVAITAQSEPSVGDISADKFLIVGMPVESAESSFQELTELWKQNGSTATEISRLRVSDGSISKNHRSSEVDKVDKVSAILDNVSKLMRANTEIEAELRSTRQMQQVLVAAVILCALGIVYLIRSLPSPTGQESCPAHRFTDA